MSASANDRFLAYKIIEELQGAHGAAPMHAERGLFSFFKKKTANAEQRQQERQQERQQKQQQKKGKKASAEALIDSASSSEKSAGWLEQMRQAYDTYKTLAALRKRTTTGGLFAGALPLAGQALRWYFNVPDSRWSIGTLSLLFFSGVAVGFAAHSELRWYLRDRGEHDDAKERALSAALKISKPRILFGTCSMNTNWTSDSSTSDDSSSDDCERKRDEAGRDDSTESDEAGRDERTESDNDRDRERCEDHTDLERIESAESDSASHRSDYEQMMAKNWETEEEDFLSASQEIAEITSSQ